MNKSNGHGESSRPFQILIADDHPLVLAGVRATLESDPDNEVVGYAADSREVLVELKVKKPDLVILDLHMPGVEVTHALAEQVKEVNASTKVLILTSQADPSVIRSLLKVKISGYLLKDDAEDNLLQAVRAIRNGGVFFSSSVVPQLMTLDEVVTRIPGMSNREQEILGLVAQGLDNPAIARKLFLAEQTVRNYVSSIFHKLKVTTRVEAVVWARDKGFGVDSSSSPVKV